MKKLGFNIRRRMREIALKLLYEKEFHKDTEDLKRRIKEIFEDEKGDSEVKIRNNNIKFSTTLIEGVVDKTEELDSLIREFSDNWDFDRISILDKNILRMSIYELIYLEDIPATVTINEAIEIAKMYGDRGTFRFINGILNSIRKSKRIEKY